MATITITPGNTFTPTETVTSTKLNNLGSPTAALTTGSIVATDLSTGAPSWDASGNVTVTGNLASGSIFTSGEAIEINAAGTGDRNAYIDFHTADPSGTDFNARIFRAPGLNADLQILNAGTGTITVGSTIAQINSDVNSITTKAYVDAYVEAAVGSENAFVPSTYAGEESVTLPNGFIMKMGSRTVNGDSSSTVTFAQAFPGNLVQVQLTLNTSVTSGAATPLSAVSQTASSFSLQNKGATQETISWLAIGY